MISLAELVAILVGLGLVECLVGWVVVARFAAAPSSAPAQRPPVTILKPLYGDEPLLEEALTSCCLQSYPTFQIVFGIQDPTDPALAVVRRLQHRFPDCDIAIVIDPTPHGPNRKVANLINMLPSARHDVLVISDSDLHLAPDYLERLVAELEKPGTGLVTSAYIGLPPVELGWSAKLGATQISHIFLPGVLLSRAMGRQDCLGSTAMLRRTTLDRTGGLQGLVQLLAEDNVLGQRVRDLGLSIGLAHTVPAATVAEGTFPALWQHEIRWTCTNRTLVPVALAASMIQYPLFWATIAVGLSGGALWFVGLFVASWAIRAVCARGIDLALRSKVGRSAGSTPIWLLPLRDVLSVVEIVASYWINEVTWRGHKIDADGRAAKPPASTASWPVPEKVRQKN